MININPFTPFFVYWVNLSSNSMFLRTKYKILVFEFELNCCVLVDTYITAGYSCVTSLISCVAMWSYHPSAWCLRMWFSFSLFVLPLGICFILLICFSSGSRHLFILIYTMMLLPNRKEECDFDVFHMYFIWQYEENGKVADSMLVNTILMLVYVTKFFWWEAGYWNTMDIAHDRG